MRVSTANSLDFVRQAIMVNFWRDAPGPLAAAVENTSAAQLAIAQSQAQASANSAYLTMAAVAEGRCPRSATWCRSSSSPSSPSCWILVLMAGHKGGVGAQVPRHGHGVDRTVAGAVRGDVPCRPPGRRPGVSSGLIGGLAGCRWGRACPAQQHQHRGHPCCGTRRWRGCSPPHPGDGLRHPQGRRGRHVGPGQPSSWHRPPAPPRRRAVRRAGQPGMGNVRYDTFAARTSTANSWSTRPTSTAARRAATGTRTRACAKTTKATGSVRQDADTISAGMPVVQATPTSLGGVLSARCRHRRREHQPQRTRCHGRPGVRQCHEGRRQPLQRVGQRPLHARADPGGEPGLADPVRIWPDLGLRQPGAGRNGEPGRGTDRPEGTSSSRVAPVSMPRPGPSAARARPTTPTGTQAGQRLAIPGCRLGFSPNRSPRWAHEAFGPRAGVGIDAAALRSWPTRRQPGPATGSVSTGNRRRGAAPGFPFGFRPVRRPWRKGGGRGFHRPPGPGLHGAGGAEHGGALRDSATEGLGAGPFRPGPGSATTWTPGCRPTRPAKGIGAAALADIRQTDPTRFRALVNEARAAWEASGEGQAHITQDGAITAPSAGRRLHTGGRDRNRLLTEGWSELDTRHATHEQYVGAATGIARISPRSQTHHRPGERR